MIDTERTDHVWQEDRGQRSFTPAQMAFRRFVRHKMALVGAGLLIALILYVSAGSLFYSEENANYVDLRARLSPPSWEHPFGTDLAGRDLLARTIYGGQISVIIGLLAVVVSVVVGVLIGAVAGFYGGWVDAVLMRFTEAVFNIPQLFLLIVLAKFFAEGVPTFEILGRTFSGSVVIIIVVIGLTSWMYLARIVRSNFLSLKEQDFVKAARCTGARDLAIITGHILPNLAPLVIVQATIQFALAILAEAGLSYLGLGAQPPNPSWGKMLNEAQTFMFLAPELAIYPGLCIVLSVLGLNLLGDGLRDLLDPKLRRARA